MQVDHLADAVKTPKKSTFQRLSSKVGFRKNSKSWWKIELNKKIIRYV